LWLGEIIKGGSQRYIGFSVSRGMYISILHAGFAGAISCMLLFIEIMEWSCNSCNSRRVYAWRSKAMHTFFSVIRGYLQQFREYWAKDFSGMNINVLEGF